MTEQTSPHLFLVRVFDLAAGSVIAETAQGTPTEAVDEATNLMARYSPPTYEVTIFPTAGVSKQQFAELTEIARSADIYLQVAPLEASGPIGNKAVADGWNRLRPRR